MNTRFILWGQDPEEDPSPLPIQGVKVHALRVNSQGDEHPVQPFDPPVRDRHPTADTGGRHLLARHEGGVRILSPKTVELMATNHLSDEEKDVAFLRDWFPGQGFGLGVSVVESVAPGQVLSSVGQNGWGGAAGTYYWVDPEEDLLAVLMVQLLPPGGIPLVPEFKTLVYQAIVD